MWSCVENEKCAEKLKSTAEKIKGASSSKENLVASFMSPLSNTDTHTHTGFYSDAETWEEVPDATMEVR